MRIAAFDLDILRAFTTGIDLGSFAKASTRVARSTSAVSAQLKKLEEQVGAPLLYKAGRGLKLTPTGEVLLTYARRLLEINDEAMIAIQSTGIEGSVRLGATEDFGEHILTDVLGRFTRAHPRIRVEVKVARCSNLIHQIESSHLDLALAWGSRIQFPHAQTIADLPMRWIGSRKNMLIQTPSLENPLPLVVIDAPCMMRSTAIEALDAAGIPWRVAFTSQSLNGVWAAVSAGLGVTIRADIGIPDYLTALKPNNFELPNLPTIKLVLSQSSSVLNPTTKLLHEIIVDTLNLSPSISLVNR